MVVNGAVLGPITPYLPPSRRTKQSRTSPALLLPLTARDGVRLAPLRARDRLDLRAAADAQARLGAAAAAASRCRGAALPPPPPRRRLAVVAVAAAAAAAGLLLVLLILVVVAQPHHVGAGLAAVCRAVRAAPPPPPPLPLLLTIAIAIAAASAASARRHHVGVAGGARHELELRQLAARDRRDALADEALDARDDGRPFELQEMHACMHGRGRTLCMVRG